MAGEPKQFEQHYRRIAIATPVGDHVLNLTHIDGTEELSRLFAYDLKMVSEKEDIKPEEIVGKNVTVTIMDVDDTPRYLNGYVRQFINRGIGDRGTVYTAEMVPWFWFLTRRTNCRIFQELTVPQIIEEIFQELGFSDFDLSGLSGSFDKRVYCVQYRETDFDFISRWMEHEGIFYYFRHEADRHVLCLCSAAGAYQPAKDKEVTVGSTSIDIVDENVFTWEHRYEFRSGKVAHADFDFEKPQQPVEGKEKTLMKTRESASFELYDYPGDFVDKGRGQALARLRMEEEETPHDVVYGTGCCRSFNPGFKFKVGRHAQKHEVGREYVITTVRHVASSGDYVTGGSDAPEDYENEFVCIPASVTYRPARTTPKARVGGPQTAIVVGPAGEEIYTDKYGRVKVKFHWDRTEQVNEKSSCWLRVSQGWAGKKWGMMAIPRIGQEVIVDFIEGDPDEPIITGRVYNGDATVPYGLPDNKTQSTIKSSSSPGSGGYNELRFEDKANSEHIYMHAQKDNHLRVENEDFAIVKKDRHEIVNGSTFEKVGGDVHHKVQGDQNEKYGGSVSQDIGMDLQQKVGMNHAVDAGMEIHLKSGMNVVVEAGISLTLKVGGNFINIGPAGIFVVGTMVMINSGGAAGSGSGCSPEAPQDAKEALDDKEGQKTEVKPRPRPEPVTQFGPSATVMKQAAKDGTPFCEKCEELKQQQQQENLQQQSQHPQQAEDAKYAGQQQQAQSSAGENDNSDPDANEQDETQP